MVVIIANHFFSKELEALGAEGVVNLQGWLASLGTLMIWNQTCFDGNSF